MEGAGDVGSESYTPRHGTRHSAPRRGNRAAATRGLVVRRPVIGGAIAIAMLGSIGATVAISDPAETGGIGSAALADPQKGAASSSSDGAAEASPSADLDTARLAESRRTTNVSRSASREEARREAVKEKKAKEEKAKEKAREKKEAAKPVSERDFTSAQIAGIQADPKPYAIELMREHGWDDGQWGCLEQLWVGESDWDWSATNSSSGAYGIPQSLPASKMASAGSDWKTNPITQIEWGLNYIKLSYGSPCSALNFWNNQSPHWY